MARARAGERRAHALVLLSEEEDDREGAGGLGRPGGGELGRLVGCTGEAR